MYKEQEDGLTTDYSDVEDQLIYRKYRYLKHTNEKSMKDIRESLIEQKMSFAYKRLKVDGKPMRNMDKFEMYQYKQAHQIKEREKIDMKLEGLMAEIKMQKILDKISNEDILNLNDP